jgi:hypothetical protein
MTALYMKYINKDLGLTMMKEASYSPWLTFIFFEATKINLLKAKIKHQNTHYVTP